MATATIPTLNGSTPGPWIEIFRAGDYRSQGKGRISREDLDRVVRNYNPAFHEAPVTIGHPADNLPAFGWIDRVAMNGDVLVAQEKQVDPQFNELRQAGRFKKRSASFYTDADGNVTGLRHVGYLGAQPPAVKGLQDVKFDDKGREFIELNFGEESQVGVQVTEKTVADQIREVLAGLFGGSSAPKTFSEDDAKRIAAEAVAAALSPLQAQLAAQKTLLDQQSAQFAERERILALGETGQRALAAMTKLKNTGRWIPAFDKSGVPELFAELAKLTTTVDFGEGDQKKAIAPLDLLVNFMESIPAIVPVGRLHTGTPAIGAPKGLTGDPLTDAAKALQREKSISFSEALDQVANEHPEWTRPGGAVASQV